MKEGSRLKTLLFDKLEGYELLLASQSPRRRALLDDCGFNFTILEGNGVEEVFPPELEREEIPLYLSRTKADPIKNQLKDNQILITADTIVWLESQVVGKPTDIDDAIRMIRSLSGKMHEVFTGVCLTSPARQTSFFAGSKVFFRDLKEEEIEYYVHHYRPLDKAGAYGIQEWIGYVGIERIEGSFYNVMGLPIQLLYKELDHFIETIERD
jgi:septum formation protein